MSSERAAGAIRGSFGIVLGAALAFALTSSSALPPVPSPLQSAGAPSSRPIQVAIVSAPDSGSDSGLAIATWALAIGTIALCVITGIGVRKQGRDMQRSVKAAEASAAAAGKSATAAADAVEAAARQRRDDLEREVNSAAHRLMATAGRISELANEVPGTVKMLLALAGHSGLAEKVEPYERVKKLRQKAAAEAITAGTVLLGTLGHNAPDGELTAGLRDMDRRLVHIELMKEDVMRQLESLNSQIEFHRQANESRLQAAGGRIPPPFIGG